MAINYLVEKTSMTIRERILTSSGKEEAREEVSVTHTSSVKTIQHGLSGLKEKLKMARKGSAKDIGWVMTDDAADPIEDETDHFYTILEDLRNGSGDRNHYKPLMAHTYLLVPGLFCNSYPTYFQEILKYFKDCLSVECHLASINTEGSVKDNGKMVKDIILKQYEQFGKSIVLLGHSKGGTDAAAACAMYWHELKDKVRGLVMLQAPYGGTPLAADLLRGGQFGALNALFLGKLATMTNPEGTVDAIKDLTYDKRREFLAEYPMASDVATVCFHSNFPPDSETRFKKYVMKENLIGSLAVSMTVPLQIQLGRQLALMSKYILSRYAGEESDGLVTRKDAEIPGSVVVKFREELAHTLVIPEAISLPKTNSNSTSNIVQIPLNAAQICQACVILLLTKR